MQFTSFFRTACAAAVATLATMAAHAAPLSLSLDAGAAQWLAITPSTSTPNNTYPSPSPINNVGQTWEAANVGWNSSTTYDTTGWAAYKGGWANSTGATPFYARTEFTIGTPVSGTFSICADDDAQVWLNGHLILDDHDQASDGWRDTNLTPYLVSGTNVLAFKAHNAAGGGFGADFKGSVVAGAPSASANASVPEPASLALVGMGLLAAVGVRRRSA